MDVPPPRPPAPPARPSAPAAPRLTREERRAETRERLLDAAAQVFNRLGFHGASLEAVAEAAGFTKGAVYSNFATKQDLFLALADRIDDARMTATETALRTLTLDQVLAGVPEVMRRQAEVEGGWDLLSIEFWLAAMRDPELRRRLSAGMREEYRRSGRVLDERLREAGLASGFTGTELVRIVNAFVSGLLLQYYLDPEGTDLALGVRALRRILGLPDEPRGDQPQASRPEDTAAPAGPVERGSG